MGVIRWYLRGVDQERAPAEVTALRIAGTVSLIAFIVATAAAKPHPGLSGRGLAVLVLMVVIAVGGVAAVISANRRITEAWSSWKLPAALALIAACADVLAAVQPKGFWSAVPSFVAIIAGIKLDRRTGLAVLALALLPPMIGSLVVKGDSGTALSLPLSAVPWYLVMRMVVTVRGQRDELAASKIAEAEAAAGAERGRLAREMHDVLAHSLSALALQLESTRLLARDRDTDHDVVRALDQAHHLAATGLDDARRAIAAARGEELPGPERLGALANAFGEQSGMTVDVAVEGEPRELAPDARLALYRTAQEALTNVRRHAAAERVEVRLDYRPGDTVLVVEDHSAPGTPPPAALGVTGSGFGLTGMRERAELLGGELLAAPTADGFRVELRLPA
jgi:signal transduction histidine kinase